MKLPNKIAVITGGNSGIGLATAHEFKQQGARVIIIGRNPAAVAAAATEVGGDTLGLVVGCAREPAPRPPDLGRRGSQGERDVLLCSPPRFADWSRPRWPAALCKNLHAAGGK